MARHAGHYGGVVRGKNLVTPDHVGQRVTFQYELPNGYVGEVVGVLRWYDDAAETFVVENREGRLVRVPAKGVRAGRPVIPRA
ncbi:MAG: hypothetical protein ACRDH8_04160 [Actinomycetota bacterium]|jgi:hypothetical protein